MELIITGSEGEDLTFSYNANFFLFVTLEHAYQPGQSSIPFSPPIAPVLTGSTVSGIAHLDRPTPAGYFIFPDLSVRNEGRYRLCFALYEDAKDIKDLDPEQTLSRDGKGSPSTYVAHRLDVYSQPFTVFSAKKFPGLTESTPLSRMVAEQGCRVRIRRDVRMRRRDKPSGDGGDSFHSRDSVSPGPCQYTPHTSYPIDSARIGSGSTVEPGLTSAHSLPHPSYPTHDSLSSSVSSRPPMSVCTTVTPKAEPLASAYLNNHNNNNYLGGDRRYAGSLYDSRPSSVVSRHASMGASENVPPRTVDCRVMTQYDPSSPLSLVNTATTPVAPFSNVVKSGEQYRVMTPTSSDRANCHQAPTSSGLKRGYSSVFDDMYQDSRLQQGARSIGPGLAEVTSVTSSGRVFFVDDLAAPPTPQISPDGLERMSFRRADGRISSHFVPKGVPLL